MVGASDCCVRTKVRITLLTVVFIVTDAAIYSLGTGCAPWYLPFFGGLVAQVNWLGLGVGGRPALRQHSSDESGELSQ